MNERMKSGERGGGVKPRCGRRFADCSSPSSIEMEEEKSHRSSASQEGKEEGRRRREKERKRAKKQKSKLIAIQSKQRNMTLD